MKTEKLIPIKQLCSHYEVEMSFFKQLNEHGLIEVMNIKRTMYIRPEKITEVERIMRLYHELEINIEGIDVIFNLLQKLNAKENELYLLRNRLSIYESE